MRSGAARKPELTVVTAASAPLSETAISTPSAALIAEAPRPAPAPRLARLTLSEDHKRWLSSLFIVLVAYGVPLAWWINTPGRQETAVPPMAAMMIDLGMEPAAPVAQADAPPGPEQTVSTPPPTPEPLPEPEPEVPPTPPMPAPEVAVDPEPEAQPEPEPLPELTPQEQAPPQEQSASTTTAPPDASSQAASAGAPHQGSSSNTSTAMPAWRDLLLHQLEAAKRYPYQARRMRQEGVSQLRFTMDRQGIVLAASIEQSSGHKLLDAEVLALIKRAQPLPKPPADIPGETLDLVIPVEFFLRR